MTLEHRYTCNWCGNVDRAFEHKGPWELLCPAPAGWKVGRTEDLCPACVKAKEAAIRDASLRARGVRSHGGEQ